jgi:hypothetical protein
VHTRWLSVPDPTAYACEVLRREAPDIPERLITTHPWSQCEMALDAIRPDEAMLERHDTSHVRRRDTFVEAIRAGRAIPPLIVLGGKLVDGYARYRALRVLGVPVAQVLACRFPGMTGVEELREIERARLVGLVEGSVAEVAGVHADDFVIVTPSGHTWTKAEYLGGIESGEIDYRRFEPVSEIDVMLDDDVAVLRYKSAIEISVGGREPGELEAWHLDCYRRTPSGWQLRWSQATAIT